MNNSFGDMSNQNGFNNGGMNNSMINNQSNAVPVDINLDGSIQNVDKQLNANNSQNTSTINNTNNTNNTNNVKNDKKNEVKMKRFKYKVKDMEGKILESYFDAENRADVESFLLNKSYQVISIEEDKLSTSLGLISSNKKMSSKDLNFFLTQLSTYVKAGIPLMDSMEILSRQVKNKNVQILYRKIVFELSKGVAFSACLEKQGRVFPKMLINMLKTSEMTGDLTGVLDDMATYYKRQDSNRKQIISAMTYPSVLLIFAICVLTFVITYIVPQFSSMYASAGADLPGITVAIMHISDFMVNYWYIIILSILAIIVIFTLLYKNNRGVRYWTQYVIMHIPVVKSIVEYNQLVTFTGTFSALIKHDVFITDSMDILNKVTDNEIYKELIAAAINNLSKGNGVSLAFKGKWAFPDTAYEMLYTGEKTGKLGEMLEHVSLFYQEEQTNIVTRLKSLIEPIMIVVLAGLVGIILLAVVVPMFTIYSKLI